MCSEAEWEYAALSGGQDREFPWSDEVPGCDRVVMGILEEDGPGEPRVLPEDRGCRLGTTAPVCTKPSGNTDQGVCDVCGNVSEWVEDYFHEYYCGAPSDGSAWLEPADYHGPAWRVSRGGSFLTGEGWTLSPRFRNGAPEDRVNVTNGIRVCRDAR